ncbi:FUSC family protein [Mangrovicoccus ximenensis]|uniref:FUSC family protein n=1 Tax=Mangrovicoccus ximenensis TaxID=1911570 RepID=UPI000D385003|nr:FUSC family protein [Mangrovicoccus ximenensis]
MTKAELGRALSLGAAAWTAFALATALGIEHAFWASMPVWVVAQPWRGVIFERALWRLLGTVLGGAAGLALLALSPSPWATAIGMALLLAAGASLTHLWQGVRSYLPLMSAITVAVVVLPAMLDPSGGLELAWPGSRRRPPVLSGAAILCRAVAKVLSGPPLRQWSGPDGRRRAGRSRPSSGWQRWTGRSGRLHAQPMAERDGAAVVPRRIAV